MEPHAKGLKRANLFTKAAFGLAGSWSDPKRDIT